MPALVALAGEILLLCAPALAQQSILADDYLNRLEGMWLGQLLGNYAGRPVEGAVQRGGLTYAVDWNTVLSTSTWDGDDDTCFEYLNLLHLNENPDPTNADLRAMWTGHIAPDTFYIANRQARWLMTQGYSPPDTGSINRNVHWYAIDSQITTESLGAVAPGMRQRASDLAGRFAGISNDGYATHAARFYAGLYAAAPFAATVEELVNKGLEVVPATSRTYQAITGVRSWYLENPGDWRATQTKIHDYYCGSLAMGRFNGWFESTVNAALTTMAILYGRGNFKDTVEIAVGGGFDADCNPATAGGLVGLMKGAGGILADLGSPAPTVSDSYLASPRLINLPPSATVSGIAAGFQQAAETQILLAGGSITGSGADRTYHIPGADAVTPPPERPDPAGPKGLVGAVKAAGGTVNTDASVVFRDPNNDRRNLDGIIDGISDPTYNGHLPYSTDDGANAQPAGGDYYQLNFDRRVRFESVIFREGQFELGANPNAFPPESASRGGYFTDLTVEVSSGGVFLPVNNLHLSEPLDPYRFYQAITLTFEPIGGEAVRIRGQAGGTSQFTTIMELEAYGRILAPRVAGDADYNGEINFADYQALEVAFGTTAGATWEMGDFDADGDVDFADYQQLEVNFGASVPEPSVLLLSAAGLCWRLSRGSDRPWPVYSQPRRR